MKLGHGSILVIAMVPSMALAAPIQSGEPSSEARVSVAVRHDTSAPLRELKGRPVSAAPDRQVPIKIPPDLVQRYKGFTKAPDPVVQTFGPSGTPNPSVVFEGLSDDDNAAVIGFRVVPPDTNGDVGPNHYVQFINLIIGVYDKNGNLAPGFPKPGNAIWQGFGGICETNNNGDPIAIYDHLADRWVVSQFAIGTDGHQCVAVSTTADPTGSYHRYDFLVTPAGLNDYPKLGVWSDAYYMTANEFAPSFLGAVAVAFERAQMLNGQPAQMVKFGPLPCAVECFFSLQPSDLDGPAPAAGTPNIFAMSFDDETWGTGLLDDTYRLWSFAVNWTNPALSTFTSLPSVTAPEFDANLCNFAPCVKQPKGGELLDTLSQFTMYRLQARHFTSHDSLVVSHTVDGIGDNIAGVRWAELRNQGAGWFLQQTGTIDPGDRRHRWMPSAAMDKAGNLAVGYSISNRETRPSIRYVTIEGGVAGNEVTLQAGAGVQQASFNRWGDYSSMSVDPTDDCTFWYTQEYYANSGSFDFKTKVGSFKIPTCQ